MAFCDLLRTTVLLAAGAATVLAAVTAIVVGTTGDTLTLFVAIGWWIVALVGGLVLGRPSQAADAMRQVLADARTATAMPEIGNPARADRRFHADRRRARIHLSRRLGSRRRLCAGGRPDVASA